MALRDFDTPALFDGFDFEDAQCSGTRKIGYAPIVLNETV